MYCIKAFYENTEMHFEDLTTESYNLSAFDELKKYSRAIALDIFHYLTDEDGEEIGERVQVAEIRGRIFDNTRIMNDLATYIGISDYYGVDEEGALINLFKYVEDKEDINPDKECKDLYDMYLERFWVEPEFRGKGIASFILDNLRNILSAQLSIEIGAVITYPKPEYPKNECEKQIWATYPELEETMYNIMKHTFVTHGYEEKYGGNWFIRDYAQDEINEDTE